MGTLIVPVCVERQKQLVDCGAEALPEEAGVALDSGGEDVVEMLMEC